MTWFKVDDDVPFNAKFAALCEGPCRADAISLWTFSGCWSSRALQEGFVPTGVVRSFGLHSEASSELVRVGLWEIAEGGFRFHDWADYQPSAEQVAQRRRAGAERKARSRARLSTAKPDVDVNESQRDHPTVTGVPRTQSRGCLAPASRDTGEFFSSSAEEEKRFSETARASRFERAPLPEPPPELPKPELKPVSSEVRCWQLYQDALGTGHLMLPMAHHDALQVVASAARAEADGASQGDAFDRATKRLLEAWMSEKFWKEKRPTLRNLADRIQAGNYTRPKAKTVVPVRLCDRNLTDAELLALSEWDESDLALFQKQRRWELQAKAERAQLRIVGGGAA